MFLLLNYAASSLGPASPILTLTVSLWGDQAINT